MDVTQIKELLTEKNAWDVLCRCICEYEEEFCFENLTGLKFELIRSERSIGSGDYDGWQWIFKLNDQLFEADGFYNSYDGFNLSDLENFYPVKEEEKIIKVYTRL